MKPWSVVNILNDVHHWDLYRRSCALSHVEVRGCIFLWRNKKPIVRRTDPKEDGCYYNISSENLQACIGICLHNKYSNLLLVYLHRTLVDVPMAKWFPPAATWASSTDSAKACCVQNEGKELIDMSPRKCMCTNDTQNMYNIRKERKLYVAQKFWYPPWIQLSNLKNCCMYRGKKCTVY